MLYVRNFLRFILLHSVIALPQFNLHLTDWQSGVVVQYDCLHVAASMKEIADPYQIISYCRTDWPSKWNIQENNLDQKFTFADLYKQNITSQQLYLWLAPMDVIERYQLYLNHLFTSNQSFSMASQLFYNCTSPRFGPLCQYSMDVDESDHLSLTEIISNFYQHEYEPTNLTCYIHLECNRGSTSACLDWSEICDGHIDCTNDGIDEKNCWQLEMNECGENEYRCNNGQCIAKVFFHDNSNSFECLDRSDEIRAMTVLSRYFSNEPTISKEDITCSRYCLLSSVQHTSSCVPKRNNLLKKIMFLDRPNSFSEMCWLAFKCHYDIPDGLLSECADICPNSTCRQVINETCSDILFIPAGALVFGHMHLAFVKTAVIDDSADYLPQYVCYNDQLCGGFYPNKTLLTFNNTTCRRLEDFPIRFHSVGKLSLIDMYIKSIYVLLYQCNTIVYNDFTVCNSSTMYRCINSSKCISKYRLCDGKNDCDYKDDEHCPLINDSCSIYGLKNLFKCKTNHICISSKMVGNGVCDCKVDEYGFCDDENLDPRNIRKQISFPTICDGFTELIPVNIDGRNETDETECEYWQCNNTYTRCDGFWNCFNGADEVDCDPSPLLKCPLHHHICVSPKTYQLMCLPVEKADDGKIDCVGATDEPDLCRSNNHQPTYYNFHCKNDTIRRCRESSNLCYEGGQCMHGDGQPICNQTRNDNISYNICTDEYESKPSDVQTFLCRRFDDTKKSAIAYFSIDKIKQLTTQDHMTHFTPTIRQYDQRCHRGLPLRTWLNNDRNLTTTICLCPPSFYGDLCQYQNQRVSLTIQFQTFSDSRRTLFALIVSLIDNTDEQIIHSYEQLTYLDIQHCQKKFNIYLFYSTRPKPTTKNYSIHIDIYEKISFAYRGSLLISINYTFLPIYRIAVQLYIPRTGDTTKICSDQKCIHGRCIKYLDDSKGTSFCQCDRGWSGKYCTIQHTCTCSSDSLCIGVSANNRSICVCPLNKWGPQCLLPGAVCQSDQNVTCHNDGQCIPVDENMASNKEFICICARGFSGERCEIADNKVIVSFHKDIILPQSILVYFIQVIDNAPPENGSIFKTIPVNQKSVIIRWSRPFHIVFVELFDNNYYLITAQAVHKQSVIISKTINSADRCEFISEVLNETIVQFHPLRRIKYYHLACQRRSPRLSCFYDTNHFCLCNDYGHQRVANCFEFNHKIEHNCFGQSNCENGAQCLQDKSTCPQTSICVCPKCFYGMRCQFSSSLFGLSLDAILGYHIQLHISIKRQPSIVQVSVALTTIMIFVGLINGVLSLIVFKNKESRKNGSGLYLLGSSITTLFTMIIFALKFWLLILGQMTYMTNRSFLYFQCISIDFLLRIGINMDQWLNACVSMERAVTTIRWTSFDKKKSKQMAKYMILLFLFLTISTTIHDPIYRHLIDDIDNDDEKRIWCIVTYSSGLQIFNSIINIFHFCVPFIINLISAFIIIKKTAQQKTRVQIHETYLTLLRKQLTRHSHLILAPVVLIIFALPRLIISFTSSCMKSGNDSWLLLTGYFISFIPPTLTFVVFVLPSKLYKEEFFKSIKRYRRMTQTRVHPVY